MAPAEVERTQLQKKQTKKPARDFLPFLSAGDWRTSNH
jgi:hypothetical protein